MDLRWGPPCETYSKRQATLHATPLEAAGRHPAEKCVATLACLTGHPRLLLNPATQVTHASIAGRASKAGSGAGAVPSGLAAIVPSPRAAVLWVLHAPRLRIHG